MAEEDSEKTEEPTQKRLEDAQKKGQIVYSRELNNFFMILALALIIGMGAPGLMSGSKGSLAGFLENAHEYEITESSFSLIGRDALMVIAKIVAIPFIAMIIAALGPSIAQNGFHISVDPIIPKFSKISPVKGFGRLFSTRSFVEFLKGLLKISVIGIIAYLAVRPYFGKFETLAMMDVVSVLGFTASMSNKMLIGVCVAMFFIAIADYLYQRFEYMKNLRMTKQEIKEEYKQQEGDPTIKSKLKQLRMERARRRMMAAVPASDVVITNPTHYSVALKYEQSKMKAPTVVAKGVDLVALKIREIANENSVPIVENPPLARSLYSDVDLDQEIPLEHYKAVAEVISYIYKIKGRKGKTG